MVNRRHLLGLLAATCTVAHGRAAYAENAIMLRIGANASETTGPIFYAEDNGFFAKHGITAAIQTMTNAAAVGSALIAGDLDLGAIDPVTMAIAHDKGLPFIYIAPGELHSTDHPTLACVVRDPNVQLGKDFNGKTMACNVSRGYGSLVTNAWIDNNGGDSATVKWIEIPFPALAAALARGAIDGYCAPEPFVSAGLEQGGHLVLLDKNPVAATILQNGWYVTTSWLSKNDSAARAFAAAIQEADAWGNANLQASTRILSKYSKVPVAVIDSMKMRGRYQVHFELRTVQPLIDAAAKYGYISKRFSARELVASL